MDIIDDVRGVADGVLAAYEDDDYVPEGYARARHILFLAAEADDTQRKAAELKRRIDAKEISFDDAAMRFSCCPTRDLNGSLGTFASLSRVSEGTLRGGTLPYEGQDTASFDQLVLSAELGVIHQVDSHWGTHLVLVEARGGQMDALDQAAALVQQAVGAPSPPGRPASPEDAHSDADAGTGEPTTIDGSGARPLPRAGFGGGADGPGKQRGARGDRGASAGKRRRRKK